jgi:hypothetical protein
VKVGLLAAVLAGMASSSAFAAWSRPETLCMLKDSRIAEVSGMGMSRRHQGVFYVHNDSGDTARFWAVNKSGAVLAEYTLPGVTAVDCEDLAVGCSPEGRPTVYLADIGDNLKERAFVSVYAAPEPDVPAKPVARPVSVSHKVLHFRYPDGAHDAETLIADPGGRALYVVTKEASGQSFVYKVPVVWDGKVRTAVRVATVRFSDPFPQFANLSTGGDMAPDGSRIIIRTYQQAYEWTVAKGERPEDALKRPPRVVALALERQGEAICYGLNGKAILTTTEGNPAPVTILYWNRTGK